jgi:hypothetical protein
VILHRQGDGWTTDVCSRITVTKLAAVGPSPVHPSPEPSATPAPLPTPSDEGSGGLGWPAVVIGLLLGVAAIAAALSLGGRRNRDRASPHPEAGEEGATDPPGSSD